MKQRRYKKPLRKKKPLHRIDDEWIINAMIKYKMLLSGIISLTIS